MRSHKGYMEAQGVTVPFTMSIIIGSTKKLAILLPDREYTSQGPLFWYANQVYFGEGFDTLQFHYPTKDIEEQDLPMIVNEMIVSFLQKQDYDSIHFISMGMGSTIVAYLLTHQLYPNAHAVWFSPYIHDPNVLEALLNRPNRGLIFLGEMGDLIEEEGAQLIDEKDHLIVAHVAGGNDLLEEESPEFNIHNMGSMIQAIQQFIKKEEIELIEEKTKIQVYFRLYGDDFPLDEVTEKLGLEPTKTEKKGEEIIPPNGRVNPHFRRYYPDTCWEFDIGYEESIDLDEQLDKFMRSFRSKTFLINELREKYDLKSFIQVVLQVENGESPALRLNKKIIRFAHQIQTEFIDFDMYVMPYDENLRFESDGVNFKGRNMD
ncbi:DUF4279 domain-containing protein [Ornithinibacillus sp. L9]|uniref:DUF4279 domain-containing protein n=1 Tax=Ornithinibacillus caprae TaxID=2678566 RepID=A0A6N8FL40_9BACI|nr:DUF4279 domain-containing protein [Ornithinibacillus caprae]MUK90362.1 DUF4279 domain-containing protein [Ornithinibacillus caprae]